MIVRIVHARAEAGNADAPMVPSESTPAVDRPGRRDDRQRLARAASRIAGLETLIVGWPKRPEFADETGEPDVTVPPSVVVLVWRDVESMVAGGADETTLFRDRLGLRFGIERAESYEVMSRTFGALPTPTGVLRIVPIGARAGGEAALFEGLRDIQSRLTSHGLIASHVARRTVPDGAEAIVVSVWSDDAAIATATGGRIDRPVFGLELEPWIDTFTVNTYEAIEIAPRLPIVSGRPILVLDGSRRVVDLTPAAAATLGRTQDETVGQYIEDLAAPGEPPAQERWTRLLDGADDSDEAGEAAWPLGARGQVMIRWRLRRNVPVPGRHTMLVHRVHESEPTQAALDEALAEAFPAPDTEG